MSARKEVPRICKWCSKRFEATRAAVNRGAGAYCCNTCRRLDQRKRFY